MSEANLAIAPSNSRILYAMVAPGAPAGAENGRGGGGGRGGRGGAPAIAFYKSTDAGENWFLATDDPRIAETGSTRHPPDTRPLGRIGGGDLPPSRWIRRIPTWSIAAPRSSGAPTTAARPGRPCAALPAETIIRRAGSIPSNANIILLVSDQGGVVSANRGESWSNWYTQPTAAVYHVTADNAFPYRLCSGQQDSGSACVESRGMDGEITFHDWHPVGIEEYGEAAPDPKNPESGLWRQSIALSIALTAQKMNVGPGGGRAATAPRMNRRRGRFARSR